MTVTFLFLEQPELLTTVTGIPRSLCSHSFTQYVGLSIGHRTEYIFDFLIMFTPDSPRLFVCHNNHCLSEIASFMNREKSFASLLEPIKLVLAVGDFALQDQRGDLLVELGKRLRNLASSADKSLDGQATLEDFLKMLKRTSEYLGLNCMMTKLTRMTPPSPLLLATLMAPQAWIFRLLSVTKLTAWYYSRRLIPGCSC